MDSAGGNPASVFTASNWQDDCALVACDDVASEVPVWNAGRSGFFGRSCAQLHPGTGEHRIRWLSLRQVPFLIKLIADFYSNRTSH